ncbi:hypothetical protein HMPREF9081_0516 [Centipeda periodontii DSM 2778]|uniref:Uncharacterized protein n=1 Tax=Centipeda periodontii DSM 2778 TaxID=888060 RepID=F5RJU5_9FIRM|nr:hypothetical protein HMPREF9081_0516 [Centipeda periodontii DSM 2778]
MNSFQHSHAYPSRNLSGSMIIVTEECGCDVPKQTLVEQAGKY